MTLPDRLLGDVIIVKAEPREKILASGIIAPAPQLDEAERHLELRFGTVLKTGPGRKSKKRAGVRLPMDLQAGDRVTFTDWTGVEHPNIAARDGEFLFMHQSDVLASI